MGSDGPFQSDLSLDETLSVLSGKPRRELLRLLFTATDGCVSVEEAIEHLNENISPAEARSIRNELYHVHIPKLVDSGLVEFDNRSKTLRYRPDDRLEKWMEIIDEEYEDV